MKPFNAAEYRANAQKSQAKRPTEIVSLQSGAVFELRRPDLQGYMLTGRVPQSLMREALAAWKKNGISGAANLQTQLDDEEALGSLIFMREVVHDCCVNPKFVEVAVNDDEIGAADMLPEDFKEIFNWAMGHKGVPGVAGLESFRKGSKRRVAGASSKRKKLQPKAVSITETETFVS